MKIPEIRYSGDDTSTRFRMIEHGEVYLSGFYFNESNELIIDSIQRPNSFIEKGFTKASLKKLEEHFSPEVIMFSGVSENKTSRIFSNQNLPITNGKMDEYTHLRSSPFVDALCELGYKTLDVEHWATPNKDTLPYIMGRK